MQLLQFLFILLIGSHWPKLVQSAGLCGNGVVNSPEECDDGNNASGDGCDSLCIIEPYYRCDGSTPNVCKIDSKISFSLLGNHRVTSSNTVVLIFGFQLQISIFNKINFQPIFSTTIPSSKVTMDYNYDTDILTATIYYTSNIENTDQSFQIMFASTPYFWYDSLQMVQEMHGVNCQLTYQENLWMHNSMIYAVITLVVVMFIIGGASIFFEKMIGLELIQTYQSVYFLMLLLKEYPFTFSALNEGMRYANGFDDVIAPDYDRTYTLPNELNALMIEKEFPINFNVDMGLIGLNALVLAALALRKARLKYRQESQINHELKKSHQRASRYFTFMFGEVFVMLVLVFMLKILAIFIVQLSSKSSSVNIFSDDTNIVLSLVSFLILFSIIIYISNWYIMTPDNLTEKQIFLSLRFRNMRFYYPIIYLLYQILHISILAIYHIYESSLYVVLSLEIVYFMLIVWIWPYNTPRKVNRILHNFTILYNQLIAIFFTCIVIRWRVLTPGKSQVSSGHQFQIYLFVILILLVIAAVLAVLRMNIFDKDVQCFQEINEEPEDKKMEDLNTFQNDDFGKLLPQERQENGKQNLLQYQIKPKKGRNDEDEPISNELVGRFLNDKYVHWSKSTNQDIRQNKTSVRMKNIKKTSSKQAELIKTPVQQYIELRKKHKAVMDSIENNDQDDNNLL